MIRFSCLYCRQPVSPDAPPFSPRASPDRDLRLPCRQPPLSLPRKACPRPDRRRQSRPSRTVPGPLPIRRRSGRALRRGDKKADGNLRRTIPRSTGCRCRRCRAAPSDQQDGLQPMRILIYGARATGPGPRATKLHVQTPPRDGRIKTATGRTRRHETDGRNCTVR